MTSLARGFYPEPAPRPPEMPEGDITLLVDATTGDVRQIDGAQKTEGDDGSVAIDLAPRPRAATGPDAFDANLADYITDEERQRITAVLLTAIDADDQSRQQWLRTRAAGIDLLAMGTEDPQADSAASTAPVEGMSTVRHPILQEAVIRFQSNASAELLPSAGPVKVRDDAPSKPAGAGPGPGAGMGDGGGPVLGETNEELAEDLEKDLNHYLTVTDKGYRADTDRMLFWVGFGGCGFKKVYNDPVRRLPISRSVDAADLIVSNSANDTDDCGRITHRIKMRKSTYVRMQICGAYRKGVALTQPYMPLNEVEQKINQVQGFAISPTRPEDHEYTIDECYCELNVRGFEHRGDDGAETGLELPYKVSIDRDARQILEIRRNWREEDPNCLARKVFVKYPFVPAMGFYDIGLLHILGNATKALTGAWRLMLDAGMFANFPGFLYSKVAGRQVTNEFRVPPGGGVPIDTANQPIGNVVMPLPYKEAGPGLAALVDSIQQTAQRVGGTAELPAGEGRADAPVGTTLALIEQATKMLAAVHIRLHAAQSEEFQILTDLLRDDPAAFWRNNKTPARAWEEQEFLDALDNCDIVPAADPNTPSHMHRIMKAVAIKQLQASNPQLYDGKAVDSLILRMLGIHDPDSLFAPPQPPPPMMPPGAMMPPAQPPDPAKMADLQLKAQQQATESAARMQQMQLDANEAQREEQMKAQEVAVESADRAADRASREKVAAMREQTEQVKLAGEMAKLQFEAGGRGMPVPGIQPPGGGVAGPGPTGGLGVAPGGFPRPI